MIGDQYHVVAVAARLFATRLYLQAAKAIPGGREVAKNLDGG